MRSPHTLKTGRQQGVMTLALTPMEPGALRIVRPILSECCLSVSVCLSLCETMCRHGTVARAHTCVPAFSLVACVLDRTPNAPAFGSSVPQNRLTFDMVAERCLSTPRARGLVEGEHRRLLQGEGRGQKPEPKLIE